MSGSRRPNRRTGVACWSRSRLRVLRSRFRLGHHAGRLAPRRMFEIRGRIAHLPILVVRLGTLELMLRRRVADFTALIAEIEFQIFAGVGFLIAVAEGAIKRIVGFRFIARFLFSNFGLSGRRGAASAVRRAGAVAGSNRCARGSGLCGRGSGFGGTGSRTSLPGSRLTTSLSTGDLSALARGRAGRIVRGVCDSLSGGFGSLSGGCGAILRTLAGTGSALNTWPHREHLKVGVSSGRTRSSIR